MKKQLVLITGGNRGIGFEAARMFLANGYEVILTSRNEEKGLQACEKIGDKEGLHYHQLDISDEESVRRLGEYVAREFGSLDILINNAAINYDTWQNALTANLDEVTRTFNVNLFGAWRMVQALVPYMKNAEYGRIVNVTSGLGSFESMHASAPGYSISKTALNALTVHLSNLLGYHNIHVNAFCPEWVRTDMGGLGAPYSAKEACEDLLWLVKEKNINGEFVQKRKIKRF